MRVAREFGLEENGRIVGLNEALAILFVTGRSKGRNTTGASSWRSSGTAI
jgi:hypothetical protein